MSILALSPKRTPTADLNPSLVETTRTQERPFNNPSFANRNICFLPSPHRQSLASSHAFKICQDTLSPVCPPFQQCHCLQLPPNRLCRTAMTHRMVYNPISIPAAIANSRRLPVTRLQTAFSSMTSLLKALPASNHRSGPLPSQCLFLPLFIFLHGDLSM